MDAPIIQSYLFVPSSNAKNLKKSEELIQDGSIVRILDLEDSIKDATDVERSAKLKEEARNVLRSYITEETPSFYIRMNDLKSSFWREDISLLSKLAGSVSLQEKCKGIVLSKSDSREQVAELLKSLKEIGLNVPIVPLIETKNGFENLEEILKISEVKGIVFGHHDFFYDSEVFPIPQSALTSNQYREILSKIVKVIKDSGRDIQFVDSVYPQLYDGEGLENTCRFLHQAVRDLKLGKLALNPFQAKTMSNITDWEKEIKIDSRDDELTEEMKRDLAKELISKYENRETKSLGVGRAGETYLSPQQYYSAKRFIKQDEEKDQELKPFIIKKV